MIAIIPARSGSVGLKNKNILKINKKPLIAYSILAALKATLVSDVIVLTDSNKIAKIAVKYGAKIPFLRPKELATSKSMVMDSYVYCIENLNKNFNKKISNFVALLPTSPLRTSQDIDNSIKIFKEKNASSVISVCEQNKPIEWTLVEKKDLKFSSLKKTKSNILNRDEYKKNIILPNGSIYVFNYKKLKKFRKYYFSDSRYYKMPKSRSVDIDDYLDFMYAEKLMEKKIK
jgi:CMP-N,N'-diacetyllegionaminic acid synthase